MSKNVKKMLRKVLGDAGLFRYAVSVEITPPTLKWRGVSHSIRNNCIK
jgi:hypothetical protein